MQSINSHSAVESIDPPTVPYETVFTPEFIQIYQNVLKYSNLVVGKELLYRNVKIYEKDHLHELYTSTSNPQLPHLVMLHGFGGTSAMYVRLFEHLHDHFQVHALDTFGVGLSSLGNFKESMNAEEAISYYTEALQEWRKALNISKFVLLGHSFGGYLSTNYLERYPKRVTRLILLSPVGSANLTEEQIEQKKQGSTFGRKVFFCIAQKVYNMRIRPFGAMNNCLIGNNMMERILSGRLKLGEEEKQAWKLFLKKIVEAENTSETGFYSIFKWPLLPERSIEMILEKGEFTLPIQFYFGDEDWMERKGGVSLAEKHPKNITLEIVPRAGHQLFFDNPVRVSQAIIEKTQSQPKRMNERSELSLR